MRKLLFLIVFVAFLPVAKSYGQASAYYNFRDPLHSLAAYHSSVYVDSNKDISYTLAQCIDSVNIVSPGLAYFTYGLRLTKRRISDGVKLRDTVVQQGVRDTTLDQARDFLTYCEGSKNNFIRLNDSIFLVLLTTLDTGGIKRIGLIAMDTNGRKLWLKEYNKPSCIMPRESIYAYSFKRTLYGEWIILAQNTCNNFTSGLSFGDVVFMKLDSNFNLLWTRLFPVAPVYNFSPTCLLVESDGYVAGINIGKENTMNWSRPTEDYTQILKVDTAGYRMWLWQSSYQEHEGINDLIATPGGGYIYSGSGAAKLVDSGRPNARYKSYNMVKKLSASRQVQWQYADTTAPFTLKHVLPLASGDYLLTGQHAGGVYGTPSFSLYAALYRIDSVGQLKWRRVYSPDTTRPIDVEPYDMALCTNGDVLLAGMSMGTAWDDTLENRQQGWLAKVDSNGCVGPFDPQCHPLAVEETFLPQGEAPQVFPNPTTGSIKIGIGHKAEMTIQDLTGRLVHSAVLQAGVQEINLSALPAGMYLYQIHTKTGNTFSGKIVKQ